ncbi:2-phospho-L-lactate transferase [uncultured Sphingosinicella sp.]|jgi:LPPG:FO 2-phospho-L-lactate transferase|uniref:2-phospho-L-lactate transferase n=1 Tax=uncultured Sphingosinicella sp. TaxID=478748 RepID=UPI0030DAB922|tara:strand:+ start:19519 stop:20448 length:930 start_codon:yes stop_codon:yes gene_type:complete
MIVALAGGVGGAKLAAGLATVLPPEELLIAVNVGDDFEHLGLTVCPDLDTVTYTLAGIANRTQGWGLEGETWNFMAMLRDLGGEDWFNLGDRDMALHVLRTQRLKTQTLSTVTADIAASLGIRHRIAPVSDDPVRSMVETDEGELAFQDYFVRRRCEPRFLSIRYDRADAATPSPALAEAFSNPALEAIIICPSNPFLSIGPILAIPGIRRALESRRVPVVAVSPFIGGKAVKGPAAKIMNERGFEATPSAVVDYYAGLLDGLVIDHADAALPCTGPAILADDTLMRDAADRERLARITLDFARSLRAR